MILALLLLLPAGVPADVAPTADTYDAFVATEETPPVRELVVPAVLKDDPAKSATFALDPRSIA